MSRIFLSIIAVLLPYVAGAQHEQPNRPGEIYALASALGGEDIPGSTPAAGFRIGGAWRPSPSTGLVADFGRHFVSDSHASFTTFMAGPRFYSGEHYRTSGFVQFLLGAQWTAFMGASSQPTDWNFVLAPGAGVDFRLTNRLVFRAVEVDLHLSRGPGLARISSGFAFRFGD